MTLLRAVAVAIVLFAVLCSNVFAADPIPAETMFKNQEFTHVQLSPDGKRLSALARIQAAPQSRNLVVLNIDDKSVKTLTGYKEEDIRWSAWVNSEHIVFKVDREYDSPDKQVEYIGTYSIRYDGKKGRQIHEPFARDPRNMRGSNKGTVGGIRETIAVIDDIPMDPEHMLVFKPDQRLRFPSVYKLKYDSRHMKEVAVNEKNTFWWFADNAGKVRAGLDAGENRDDLEYELIYRENDDAPWKTVVNFHQGALHVFGFDHDNLHLWVASRVDSDKFRLYRLNPETGEFGEPVVEDPDYDVYSWSIPNVGWLQQTDDGRAVFYEYMAEKPKRVYFDEAWSMRQAALDQAFPETVNSIVDWSRDETKFLVKTWSDRVHGAYYLYDEKAAKVSYLLSNARWLDPNAMAPMEPIEFTARDGMTMPGYLTRPVDSKGQKVPLIIYPHGGPYGIRDGWGFNQDVQFLASHGYAVLQVNYRGSGGYGWEHQTVGYKKRGLEMQDDLADAVHWAIEQGIADPDRVCIYGGSYGGYAAVMGLVKTPDLYACGINYAGVVDLNLRYKNLKDENFVAGRRETNRAWFEEYVGNPVSDKDRFYETSPIHHVEKIEAPVLMIHGRLDYVVDIEHYRRFIGQLEKYNKPHDKLMKRYEGHGFFVEQNKIELYTKIEEFLRQNL